jgi:CRP-like cAMP-binding protein
MGVDNEINRILLGMNLFAGCTEENIKTIVRFGKKRKFLKGDHIITEGEDAPGLFVLLSGELEVHLPKNSITHNRITDIHLYNMSRGDYVGEFSLIDGKEASAEVIVTLDCLIFHISRKDFNSLVNQYDDIAKYIYRNMLEVMVERARKYDDELDW